MRYEDLIINIEDRIGKFRSFGNTRIKKFLEYFESPENSLKVIHVAGTNGKGSCSYFLKEILKSDFKVGLYTSPHLFSHRDRIVINDREISEEDFVKIGQEILDKEKYIIGEYGKLNNFEFLTAMAIIYFQREKCELVILEVGMGGRADSTSIIEDKNKLISLITSISFDHMKYLGDTLEEIALAKAGIISRDGLVVTSNTEPKILKVLEEEALKKNADIFYSKDIKTDIIESDLQGSKFFMTLDKNYFVTLDQIGTYEIENAVLSLYGLYILVRKNIIKYDFKKAVKRIKGIRWKGRMDLVRKNPMILLDGAHNLDAIKKLRINLSNFKYDKLYLITSILKDKDHKNMIKEISPCANQIILINLASHKNEDLEILKKEAGIYENKIIIIEDLEKSLKYLYTNVSDNDLILITGSLELVKEFYKLNVDSKLNF